PVAEPRAIRHHLHQQGQPQYGARTLTIPIAATASQQPPFPSATWRHSYNKVRL
ncbi:hypothetical protein LINGRAHAP2_LOCUS24916, partial [Linum grandiflorum]